MGPGILVSRDTWDYPGMSLVRVTDYTAWVLDTWDYPGMSLVRVTDYTAWVLEYLYPGILGTILGCP